jgi:hypothetical protein
MRPIDYWTYFWFGVTILLIPTFIIFLIINTFNILEIILLILLFILLECLLLGFNHIIGDLIFPTPYAQTWKEWFKYRYNRDYENFVKEVRGSE